MELVQLQQVFLVMVAATRSRLKIAIIPVRSAVSITLPASAAAAQSRRRPVVFVTAITVVRSPLRMAETITRALPQTLRARSATATMRIRQRMHSLVPHLLRRSLSPPRRALRTSSATPSKRTQLARTTATPSSSGRRAKWCSLTRASS